jgi:DNA polymerase III delta prime subunit
LADRYITHNVLLEAADFNILVIEFPEEDVNDKLAVLASEKGLIYKHLYEDFVLSSCMANSGPFFFHIRKRPELLMRFAEIRKEALDLVFRLSPGFRPENIFINENNILKTKSSLKSKETPRPLIDNDLWDQEPPLSNFGPGVIISAPNLNDDDDPLSDMDDEDSDDTNLFGPEPPSDNPFADGPGGGMGGDVPYDLVGHKWDTSGVHINVRQYEESGEALINLLGGTPFESVKGYHLLVVELCIEDFSDVFHLLDKMGVSKKHKPEELIKELYEISMTYNPFLKLEDINLKKIKREYIRRHRASHRTNNRRLAAAGNQANAVRKRGIKFSDLTNEKLLSIYQDMKKKIVGQDEAIEHIADAIQRASVGLKRDHEPIGVLLFTGKTGVGKCLAPGTEVLMYDGLTKVVEEIIPGDLLMGPDSLPREVLSTCSGEDEMFEISPVKGKPWACNASHILTLVHTVTGEIIDIPLNEYLKQHKTFKHLHKLFRVPVNFENEQAVPVDPYLVGLWLGDGRKDLSSIQIANIDPEVISYLSEVAGQYNLQLVNYEKRQGFCPSWALTAGNVGGKANVLLNSLRLTVTEGFGLTQLYKTASEKERLALLAGFIDADGSLINNCYEIGQKNSQIAKDFAFVARSLGFMVTESVRKINGTFYQRLFISGNIDRIPVKIVRKKATPREQIKNALRTGFSVRSVNRGQYHGFTLPGDGRFLLGDFTVTHNTETAKVLADTLGARLVRIDCQEYQQPHEVAKLTGSPPGYVGYDDGGHLTKEVAKYPFSVVLFDEVEKGHPNFHERILQIIDDGILTEAKGGRKIPFNETLILMTSNIGVKEVDEVGRTLGFGDVGVKTGAKATKARAEALKKRFKPEFLNRVDEVVHFRDLEKDDFLHVLDIILNETSEQLQKSRSIGMKINPGAKNFLLDHGIDKKFGARPLRRAVKKYLSTPVAKNILKEEISNNSKIVVNLDKDKSRLVFRQPAKKVLKEQGIEK